MTRFRRRCKNLRRLLAAQVRAILGDLSPKERKILEMRHGLMDGIYHTLEEVGREFGVTRERIRQIEAKALGENPHPRPRPPLEVVLERIRESDILLP